MREAVKRDLILWKRIAAARRRRAHEGYLLERECQQKLEQQDVQQAIHDVSIRAGGNQQSGQ